MARRSARDAWVTIVVSGAVLATALTLILCDYPEQSARWAFGAVGLILGYWLR